MSDHWTNLRLAKLFRKIADLLEIKGEVIYKILAYRKAADSLESLGRAAYDCWQEGRLTEIPGVGKAIADKIAEIFTTGRLEFLQRLEAEVPPTLVDLLQVPEIGPKKVTLFWRQAGVTNLAELRAAALAGRLRTLPGMGEKSEARILAGLDSLARRSSRIPLGQAWPFAQHLLADLRQVPGVQAAFTAGSLRRMRSTVGDLDLLVAACDSGPVMTAFTVRPDVIQVISRGDTKASVEFDNGLRAQLWVHPPERFGTALAYATGSKEHNVRLRELAQKAGLSLSEHSFLRPDGSEILCATEEALYATLDLPWIPPELREDHGEIQAARSGRLPDLIRLEDLYADLHTHTTWSDGRLPVLDMARAAQQRGMSLLAITDHSGSLGVAGGLQQADLPRQRQEIQTVQEQIGPGLHLLQGSEVEIRSDGSLDFPDEVLADLDVVVASLHSGLRQPREKITERLVRAIRNPHVDIIGHPSGRLIPDREGADLDMEAVLAAAAEHGVALEINANPARLDLDEVYARRASEMGIPLSINSDAHCAEDMDLRFFGISVARRAWVPAEQVINTWPAERLLDWLHDRKTARNTRL